MHIPEMCIRDRAWSIYSMPSVPMTLAISWGSVMTVVVPWGSTALANSVGLTRDCLLYTSRCV